MLEVILLLVLVIYLFFLFIKKEKRPGWSGWIPIIVLFVVLMHFVIDGQRWQMYISYSLAAILALNVISSRFRKGNRKQANSKPSKLGQILTILGSVLGLVLIGLCAIIANIFPVPTLQAPTGQYEVGTTYLHLIDYDREEKVTDDTTDHRSLWLQAWYPAGSTDSHERALVLPESERYMGELFKRFGIPPFAASHLESVKSFSYLEAPIISGSQSFPVILYSHGLTGNLSGNTQKMEALASHGYVVYSVAHSYGTQISLKEDGTWLTTMDPNIMKPSYKISIDSAANALADQEEEAIFKRAVSPANLTAKDRLLLDSLNQLRFRNVSDHLNIRAADLSFVLNKVEQMQKGAIESKFENKLDLTKVGAFGGSLGGPSAMLFSAQDARCLVTANLDGSQFGILYQHDLNKPHMHFDTDIDWKKDLKYNDWENIGNATPYYNVVIKGAGHGNIGDQLYSSVLTRKMELLGMGTIKPERIYDILNSYLLAYFDQYLKDDESSLLKSESRFEEVNFEKYE